jgi:ring-1,2-phenylacetyl-CoA epoxidase subunit PaaC
MSDIPDNLKTPFVDLLLALADDKLVLGHRNSDWTGLGPILEEDIAFSALAQDEMSHAQAICELLAPLTGRTADQIAFGRTAHEYRCAHIVEVPDAFDYATAITRQFFCDHFDVLRLARLSNSSHEPIAALAKRLIREEQVHVEHSDSWMIRLGTGTIESNKRLQDAVDQLLPIAPMLFEHVEHQQHLVDEGLYPGSEHDMLRDWTDTVTDVAKAAKLHFHVQHPAVSAVGGRRSNHTEHLAPLLEEMTEVWRLEPDAAW